MLSAKKNENLLALTYYDKESEDFSVKEEESK